MRGDTILSAYLMVHEQVYGENSGRFPESRKEFLEKLDAALSERLQFADACRESARLAMMPWHQRIKGFMQLAMMNSYTQNYIAALIATDIEKRDARIKQLEDALIKAQIYDPGSD